MPGCSSPRPSTHRVLVAITSPVHAADCDRSSPRIPWRDLVAALQPLHLQAALVRHSAAHAARQRCDLAAHLHQSLVDDSSAGVRVAEHFCENEGCSLDKQLAQISAAATEFDVVLLITWQTYRNGLDIKCSTKGCLQSLVGEMFSFSEDSSRCSGAARALSVPFSQATCLEAVSGTNKDEFVVNPSNELYADEISMLPGDAFRTAVQTIAADVT